MYNCQVVMVSASTFENNRAQSVFTDLPSRVSGGGLSITIYGNSNGSVVQGTFNYTIQNCTFYNNSANSTVPTASPIFILEGGHFNDRGGGVAFYVVHTSVLLIKILQCNFTNNSAPFFGGGLVIFSPEVVAEEVFTVADSYFEGNEAENGGGISVGATVLGLLTEKHKVLLKDVVYARNIFVRNRARFGGALFLGRGKQLQIVEYTVHVVVVGGGGVGWKVVIIRTEHVLRGCMCGHDRETMSECPLICVRCRSLLHVCMYTDC